MFKKILIANRGEIACRIQRTARAMGIATVAVYSETDAAALHVALADEAYCLGPAAATRSYLNGEEILRVAHKSGAEAIHPGYGFLAENPEFARACADAGLVFVGPPPEVITAMGIKSRAKEIMAEAGIPVIPGCYLDAAAGGDPEAQLKGLDYPLLVKADRGGGGKGIRLVHSPIELREAIAAAGREAAAAFGDTTLLVERQVTGARHIEVQIFRDSHGNGVHLFERDCSLQRRHQKIVEEAPAPRLSATLRQQLHEAAVAAAEAAGYLGAGTVEFLVEGNGSFYFLEINTRLQVEHPVTEMLTGEDLVKWQLLVAAGERLPLRQEELRCLGHAVEARIYAEDPARNFLPSSGLIHHLREPAGDDGLRLDSGIREGDRVSPHYDPILAKLIAHGPDREAAIRTLKRGLGSFQVAGVATNIDFLQRLLADPAFISATHTTGYVDGRLEELPTEPPLPPRTLACAALWRVLDNRRREQERAAASQDPHSPWSDCLGFRLNAPDLVETVFHWWGQPVTVLVYPQGSSYKIATSQDSFVAEAVSLENKRLSCRLDGQNIVADVAHHDDAITIFCRGRTVRLLLPDPERELRGGAGAESELRAPIPGNITKVFVAKGDLVGKGDALLVLEAMKMEYVIRAPADGRVAAIRFAQGDSVREKDRLVEFQPTAEADDAAA